VRAPRPLAIRPDAAQAFLELSVTGYQARPNVRLGDYEVVEIVGPLESRADGCCDDYESIRTRVALALESDAPRVLLVIDSPGGDVTGCFDLARVLRTAAAQSGKELHTYVEGDGCSAAYALASCASSVVVSATARLGSIGVVYGRYDASEAMAREGYRVHFVASSQAKSYGAPERPYDDAEAQATQSMIDSLAAQFFALVAEHRGLDPTAVAGMGARLYVGRDAVTAGLADAVMTLDEMISASVAPADAAPAAAPTEDTQVTLAEVLSALSALAAGEGEEASAAAALLAAASAKEDDGGGEGFEAEEPADPPDEPQKEEEPAAAKCDDEPMSAVASLSAELKSLREEFAQLVAASKVQKPKAIATVAVPAQAKARREARTKDEVELDRVFGLNQDPGPRVSQRGNVMTFSVR